MAAALITTAEAAVRLGVSPRRVRRLRSRSDFPRPAFHASRVLLWNAAEIDHWAATADRRTGRPRKPVAPE